MSRIEEMPLFNTLIKKSFMSSYNPFNHVAAFVPDFAKNKNIFYGSIGRIAIGKNSERKRFGNNKITTHAEADALNKLYSLIRIGKLKKTKVDLIVIRVNKSGNLCESAPCYHCTKELLKTSFISINKLYYSRSDGTISCIKFSDWINSNDLQISKGWKWIQKLNEQKRK